MSESWDLIVGGLTALCFMRSSLWVSTLYEPLHAQITAAILDVSARCILLVHSRHENPTIPINPPRTNTWGECGHAESVIEIAGVLELV